MTWETVIGLETHVELSTKTKIFCSCTTAFGGDPNTHCCPVCMGMPGTLPVVNEKVLEYAVKVGLALDGEITRSCRFDRKNYFYPDLPKAYQISQLYLPIVRNGRLPITTESGGEKTIRIHELHMEEDAGKLVHDPWIDQTRCDYNRCGVPLIEIVTEPDFRSAEEVVAYLEKLRSTLQYLGVSDCKMQEGSLRCDVNLSVRPVGSAELGTRTEMKNLNSFKAIARSIQYEARRQIELLEERSRLLAGPLEEQARKLEQQAGDWERSLAARLAGAVERAAPSMEAMLLCEQNPASYVDDTLRAAALDSLRRELGARAQGLPEKRERPAPPAGGRLRTGRGRAVRRVPVLGGPRRVPRLGRPVRGNPRAAARGSPGAAAGVAAGDAAGAGATEALRTGAGVYRAGGRDGA